MSLVPYEGTGRHPLLHGGGRRGISWRWNWRLAAIAAIAVGLAAGLGIGIASYVGSHQSGPPTATASGGSGADQARGTGVDGSAGPQAGLRPLAPARRRADGQPRPAPA